MSDETKITLKMGVIASLVASFVIFFLTALWSHQTDITILKSNQMHMVQTLQDLKSVPTTLATIQAQLIFMNQTLAESKNQGKDGVPGRTGNPGKNFWGK